MIIFTCNWKQNQDSKIFKNSDAFDKVKIFLLSAKHRAKKKEVIAVAKAEIMEIEAESSDDENLSQSSDGYVHFRQFLFQTTFQKGLRKANFR